MSTRQTLTITGPEERQRIAAWARNVEIGTVVTFRKKSRSTEQSAKMWAMLGEVSDQVEWYGAKLDAEDWKDVFTASLRHARVVPGIDKGTFVPLGMHTSTLTIEEMSNLIELIYAFGADPEHPVVFKDPQQNTSHSGEEAPSASPDDDAAHSASEGDGGSPASSPSSLSDADLRTHLMDFARKASRTLTDPQLGKNAKASAIGEMIGRYREETIPREQWPKLSGVTIAFEAVLTGKRSIEQARDYLARDIFDCSVAEIGGAA